MISTVVIPERPLPWLVKLLGGKFRDGRWSYRMKWGELNFSRGTALALCMFEDHFSLHVHFLWTDAYIALPVLNRWLREPDEMMEKWGVSLEPEFGLQFSWGTKTKFITMPWRDWAHIAHEVRRADGSWVPFVGSWEIGRNPVLGGEPKEPDGRHEESYPYHYMLRSGEVQERVATIYVERWRSKLRWLRWLPFERIGYGIHVSFNEEVGERTGSWKGGCVGCSYGLRRNETPLECLRRMERDRKF